MDGLYYREPEDVLVDNMCYDDENCNSSYNRSVEDEVIQDDGSDIDRIAGLPEDNNSDKSSSEKHITNKIADELETEISGSDDDSVEYDVEEDNDKDEYDDISEYEFDENDDIEEVF